MVRGWLNENRLRFDYQPYIVEDKEDYLTFQFSGIAPEIVLVVLGRGNFEIHIVYQDSTWDIAADFDVGPSQTEAGLYYCRHCLPEARKYYPSLSDLIYRHSLEPLLEWAKETFQKTRWMGLFEYEGAAYVKIIEESDLLAVKKDPHFAHGFPIVQS
jgi:hypothetical protein